MNKTANFNIQNMSAPEILGYSALLGGGGYGLLKLLREVQTLPPSKKEEDSSMLNIDVPRAVQPMQPKMGLYDSDVNEISGNTLKVLAGLTGVPLGFMGASKIYNTLRHQNEQSDIERANQQYLEALKAVQTKNAEVNTPCVDAFCEGAFEHIKMAVNIPEEVFAAGNPEANLIGNVGNAAYHTANKAAGGIPNNLMAALAILGLGSGALVYGAANKLDHRDEDQRNTVPTRVGLKYV